MISLPQSSSNTKPKTTGDCCVFKFLRCRDGKHFLRFQSKKHAVFKFLLRRVDKVLVGGFLRSVIIKFPVKNQDRLTKWLKTHLRSVSLYTKHKQLYTTPCLVLVYASVLSSGYLWIFNFKTESNTVQMSLQSFYSAVMGNSKINTRFTFSTKGNTHFVLVQSFSNKSEQPRAHFAPRLVFRWEH